MDELNAFAIKQSIFRYLSEKTGVLPAYLLIATFIFLMLLLHNGILIPLIQAIFGFLYPGYMTFRGLEFKDEDEEMGVRFRKYWVVLCVGIGLYMLLLWFIPEFPLLQLSTAVAVIFLVKSDAALAVYLYDNCLEVNISKMEKFIDEAITFIEYQEEHTKLQ